MRPVGYLIKRDDGLYGERGAFFDYVLAGNGLWVEAEGPLLAARIPIAPAEVRGLANMEPRVVLRYGLIPGRLWELALNVMLANLDRECYVAIRWGDGEYRLRVPKQEGRVGGVRYEIGENTVLDLHSHGGMRPWFSGTDNKDEQGLKLYGVVGHLGQRPELRLRVGVYGYFHGIGWCDIFSGNLIGVDEELEKDVSDRTE